MEKIKQFIRENVVWLVLATALLGFFIVANRQAESNGDAKLSTFSTINPQSAMTKGKTDASVALVQYSDFLCPSCSYFSTQVMPQIEQSYIKTGKVGFEFRPIAFVAEGSQISAEGAYCAIDQGKFWEYHDTIYGYVWETAFSKGVDPLKNTILTSPIIKQIVAGTTLDGVKFGQCLDTHAHQDTVLKATAKAQSQGVNSTPYIMINGQQIKGSPSLVTVNALIKAEL